MVALLIALRVLLGDPFPPATLPTLSGPVVELPAQGRVTIVEVFATWCGSCREALPQLERLRERFGSKVTFVTVSEDDAQDARAKLEKVVAESGLAAPVLLDTDHALYQRLGVRRLPTTYLVDRAGVVRHINNGHGPGYEQRLAGWLVEVLRAPAP